MNVLDQVKKNFQKFEEDNDTKPDFAVVMIGNGENAQASFSRTENPNSTVQDILEAHIESIAEIDRQVSNKSDLQPGRVVSSVAEALLQTDPEDLEHIDSRFIED